MRPGNGRNGTTRHDTVTTQQTASYVTLARIV